MFVAALSIHLRERSLAVAHHPPVPYERFAGVIELLMNSSDMGQHAHPAPDGTRCEHVTLDFERQRWNDWVDLANEVDVKTLCAWLIPDGKPL